VKTEMQSSAMYFMSVDDDKTKLMRLILTCSVYENVIHSKK